MTMPVNPGVNDGSRVVRASQVMGTQVWDPTNQQLGTIKDVIIDYGAGYPAAFFAVAPQIPGVAEGYVVIPFDVMRFRYDNRLKRDYAMLDIPVAQFRIAPRIEGENWVRIRDPQFLGQTAPVLPAGRAVGGAASISWGNGKDRPRRSGPRQRRRHAWC